MSDEIRALYPSVILEHRRSPRNEGQLDSATHRAQLDNPLCGDRVTVQLRVEGDRIRSARFTGKGCAISLASASILTEAVQGRSLADATGLAARLIAFTAGASNPPDLGPLEPLRGVRTFPGRKRCATLAWEALRNALGPAGG